MTAIVDYGVGNLFSLVSSVSAVSENVIVTADAGQLREADRIILPGVGAFRDAAAKLKACGLDRVVIEEAGKGKPLLGICLGMQMLFDRSYEYGCYCGLGLIRGEIKPIADVIAQGLKIPHIGWNALNFTGKQSDLLRYIKEGDCVYFVHSYYAANCAESVVATAEYSTPLTAIVQNANVYGCQFHPEKSGKVGLAILKAFCEL